MLTKSKMMIVAALVFGSASTAMAQSYDPDIGSGNIGPSYQQAAQTDLGALDAYAQVPASVRSNHVVGSFTSAEKTLFNRIRPE
jgi:hypothetical protein